MAALQRVLSIQCARTLLHVHNPPASASVIRNVLPAVCVMGDELALMYVARSVAFPARLLEEAVFLTPLVACLLPISYFGCTHTSIPTSYAAALSRLEDHAVNGAIRAANTWMVLDGDDGGHRREIQCRLGYLILQLRLVNCLAIVDPDRTRSGAAGLRERWVGSLGRCRYDETLRYDPSLSRLLVSHAGEGWAANFAPDSAEARDVAMWHHALVVALLWSGSIPAPSAGLDAAVEYAVDRYHAVAVSDHPIVWFPTMVVAGLRESVAHLTNPGLLVRTWNMVDDLSSL